MPPALPVSLLLLPPSPPLPPLSQTFINPHNIPQNSSVTRRLAASGKDRGNEKGGGFTRFTERVRKEWLDKLGSYLIVLLFPTVDTSGHRWRLTKTSKGGWGLVFPSPFRFSPFPHFFSVLLMWPWGGSSYLCRVEHPHRPFDLPISPWALLDRLICSAATSAVYVKWREEH